MANEEYLVPGPADRAIGAHPYKPFGLRSDDPEAAPEDLIRKLLRGVPDEPLRVRLSDPNIPVPTDMPDVSGRTPEQAPVTVDDLLAELKGYYRGGGGSPSVRRADVSRQEGEVLGQIARISQMMADAEARRKAPEVSKRREAYDALLAENPEVVRAPLSRRDAGDAYVQRFFGAGGGMRGAQAAIGAVGDATQEAYKRAKGTRDERILAGLKGMGFSQDDLESLNASRVFDNSRVANELAAQRLIPEGVIGIAKGQMGREEGYTKDVNAASRVGAEIDARRKDMISPIALAQARALEKGTPLTAGAKAMLGMGGDHKFNEKEYEAYTADAEKLLSQFEPKTEVALRVRQLAPSLYYQYGPKIAYNEILKMVTPPAK